MPPTDFEDFEIPLPPIEVHQEIVDELEAEVYSDPDSYTGSEFSAPELSYDEVFEDDDS